MMKEKRKLDEIGHYSLKITVFISVQQSFISIARIVKLLLLRMAIAIEFWQQNSSRYIALVTRNESFISLHNFRGLKQSEILCY